MTTRVVVAGKVQSVHPGKRQVRIQAPDEIPDDAFLGRLRMRLADGREIAPMVATLRRLEGIVLVQLTPGTTRDTVAQLKGAEVLWEADENTLQLMGRQHVDALIGMRLIATGNVQLGVVVGALSTPAHGVIEAERPDGRRLLLPVIPEVVERIDWDDGVIFVGDIAPYVVDDAD